MSSLAPIDRSTKSTPSTKPRVKFDEDGIAVDYAERGVLYGTQKIDQVETPYIYYDSDEDPIVHLNSNTSNELGVPQRMEAAQLQAKLGLLLAQQTKATTAAVATATSPMTTTTSPLTAPTQPSAGPAKWEQAEKRMDFESKRRQLYAAEGNAFAKGTGGEGEEQVPLEQRIDEERFARDALLPNGWISMASRSDGAIFYYHHDTNTTQWTVPTKELVVE